VIGRAAERVPGLRRVPLLRLIAVAEIALLTRDHVTALTAAERRRLIALMRAGRGRPSHLTKAERSELEVLVAKLAPRRLLGESVDALSPVPLPRRVLYGRNDRR